MRRSRLRSLAALAAVGAVVAIGAVDRVHGTNPRPGAVPEQEPNDTCPGQSLGCGQVIAPAYLQPGEQDWYEFFAVQNDVITLVTDQDQPTDNTNTVLELYANDCTSLLAADDDGGNGMYSLIQNFVAPYTGSYHVLVTGPDPFDQGGYILITDCQPGMQKLTRQEAIDIVLNDVIPFSPYADSLVAFILDPDTTGVDSTFAPGTVVADWDSSYVEVIPSEVYMFWLDNEPQYEFGHATTVVLVDAFNGFVQPFDGDGYPIVNDEERNDYVNEDDTPRRWRGALGVDACSVRRRIDGMATKRRQRTYPRARSNGRRRDRRDSARCSEVPRRLDGSAGVAPR